MFDDFIRLTRDIYRTDQFIPLHAPLFNGREKEYVLDAIDSTFVSSVGEYVDRFEREVAEYTGSGYAVAAVNGTSALHIALLLAGVEPGTEVITQTLTFVATCNAVSYCGAYPVFVDVDKHTLGLSPGHLRNFLETGCEIMEGRLWNKTTGKRIAACLPMHAFGNPIDMDALTDACNTHHLPIVEDAAEAFGSSWKGKQAGTLGKIGILSFNGNKIITTGGGGMILTDDETLAKKAKHLTTTAKLPHKWEFFHDHTGYNYRMPNLNAALGVAQLEKLPRYIREKREIASRYKSWCDGKGIAMITEQEGAQTNAWLNSLILEDRNQRDAFLEYTNGNGVMTRPLWEPMHKLPMYSHCAHDSLENSLWAADRIVNVPSGAIRGDADHA